MEETRFDLGASRYENLPNYVKAIFFVFTTAALSLSTLYLFNVRLGGVPLYVVSYYYLFVALFLFCTFIIVPARTKDRTRVPWYDFVIAALAFGIGFYFFLQGKEIGETGWRILSPAIFTIAFIYCLLVLEAGRRMAGSIYLAVCLLAGLYPLIAAYMPGVLRGLGYTLPEIVSKNIFTCEGMLGMPLQIMAGLMVGFLIFAGFLMGSGAARVFLNLATALLGTTRGGPAKVAVLSSGFFASLSGSGLANIVSTGSFTIPAMKRMGYPPHYAGAIEATASSGGPLMPPVMGAIAFIMAAFLGVDYGTIVVAAAIPAILYYFGLLLQVDAYAARVGLEGLPREELPSLKQALKEAWPFIFVLLFLVWGLVYMKLSIQTPFYATGLLILLSFRSRETMMTPKRFYEAIVITGKLIAQGLAIILPILFILAGLVTTGVAPAFTSLLLTAGGENVFLILIVGVIACYILGMAGLIIPAYIFLAVGMAPTVVQTAGLNELAVHLFIIYYAGLAAITPPIAPGAFIASTMAGASPMKTAFTSMRLAVVIYFIPFFFVFNPSLILQGPIFDAVYLFALCLLGIVFIAAGLEGYLLKVGRVELWARPLLIVAGVLIGFPEWNTTFIGAALAAVVIAMMLIRRKRATG